MRVWNIEDAIFSEKFSPKSSADPPLRQKSIISTPKIDFRADFRPTSAGNFPCFDLLKIRRPLRHPTKTAQKKGLV